MPDFASREVRRRIMQAVGREDTGAERLCAAYLEPFSEAYTRHPRSIPGKPDFYFASVPLAVFVHGCFWHGHDRCPRRLKLPDTNAEYWAQKIRGNRSRDSRVSRRLRSMGISVFTLWECRLRQGQPPTRLLRRLERHLAGRPA